MADSVPELEDRVAALEKYVARNDARISAIEGRQAAAISGATREMAAARSARQRDRWLDTLRRR